MAPAAGGRVFASSSRQPFIGRDGQLGNVLVRGVGSCSNGFDIVGSAVWTDTDFNGQSDNLRRSFSAAT